MRDTEKAAARFLAEDVSIGGSMSVDIAISSNGSFEVVAKQQRIALTADDWRVVARIIAAFEGRLVL